MANKTSRQETGGAAANAFEARVRAVAAGLRERKLDALLVAFSPNLRYLSGFTGSNGNLLITERGATLFTDPRYTIQAQEETTARVKIVKGPVVKAAGAEIRRAGVKRIGYEPARMTCDAFEAVKKDLPMRAAMTAVSGWIEELRMVKSEEEADAIRRSVETNSRAFEYTVARIKAGIPERDLAAELEYRMRKFGASKPAFETIVAAGARSALPHAQPTGAKIAGGFVVVDMGAVQDGYCSDMTRMLYAGVADAKAKRMYKAVLEAQLAAIDAVRPGVTAGRVDAAARGVLKGYGLDKTFIHSTGHGLGLEIHEPPRLGKKDKTKLKAGMAITIEPGVYVEGVGGVRIEDTVLVTSTGCEVLTAVGKELVVV